MDNKVLEKIQVIIEPILKENGVELFDLSFRHEGPDLVLSILIDKNGGIDLEDCSNVSDKVSLALDKEDPIEGSYLLEVASAGAEKPLKNTEQLVNAIDEYILVQVKNPVEGYDELVGYLRSANEEEITLEIKIKTRVKKVVINRSNIAMAMTCVKL